MRPPSQSGCVQQAAPRSVLGGRSVAVPSFLARERIVARPGFNRWLIPPAALAVHLCIGQAYATSVYKTALVEHFDTSLTAIGIIFSIAIVMLGLSAALFGTWVDRNGPRAAMFTSAVFWVSGFLVGSLGIATEQLWLTLALVYLVFMMFGAFLVRVPAADWRPDGFDPSTVKKKALVTTENVS